MLRAFSSGCAALTGVEAISNGVPAFQKPKSKNAATTLLLMGSIAVTMLVSMMALSRWTGVKIAEDPATQLTLDGVPVGDDLRAGHRHGPGVEGRVLGLPARRASSSRSSPGSSSSSPRTPRSTASRCSARSSPATASCRASCTPAATGSRSPTASSSWRRSAAGLIVIYNAEVTRLIQLYIVGVFVSFTLSQIGMVRHWTRHLTLERNPQARAHMMRSRVINGVGAAMCGTVLRRRPR